MFSYTNSVLLLYICHGCSDRFVLLQIMQNRSVWHLDWRFLQKLKALAAFDDISSFLVYNAVPVVQRWSSSMTVVTYFVVVAYCRYSYQRIGYPGRISSSRLPTVNKINKTINIVRRTHMHDNHVQPVECGFVTKNIK